MSTRTKNSMRLVTLLIVALAISPSAAHHTAGHDQNPNPPAVLGPTDIIHFEAGSLIIPMDGCYQRPTFMSTTDVNQAIAPYNVLTALCNGTSEKDDGLIPAYTLMFRLVQNGIPVHWAIRSAKTGWHDVDFSVVRAGGSPVLHRFPGGTTSAWYVFITTVRYRGAPFVISAEHADAALALMDSWEGMCNTGTCYDEVDIHVAQVSFDAPIFKTIETLPKLAMVDVDDAATGLDNPQTNFLVNSVDEAIMADLEGTLFDWVTIPEVMSDALTSGNYDLVWVPPFDLTSAPTAGQQAFFDKLAAFADGGGSLLFQDGAIGALEGHGTMSGMTYNEDQPTSYDFQSNGAGLVLNGTSGTWDNGDDDELTAGTDYSDPASQFGGIVWTGIGGSAYNWRPRYDEEYDDGVRRMIFSDSTDESLDNWDFASWRRKDNDSDKGLIYYLGGFHWRRVTAAGFRVLMNTLLATQASDPDEIIEMARSAPIVGIVDGIETQYQGTFETEFPPDTPTTYAGAADDDTFQFPGTLGHMRALDVSLLAEGDTSFADVEATPGVMLFDAADHLPPVNYAAGGCAFPADGTCRRIFTDTGDPTNPTELMVSQGNVATLKPMLDDTLTDDEALTLISRIHAGRYEGGEWVARLGGVDRSTVAVIEPSPLIPNGRPTVMYFGGTDGMLHAVCAEVSAICPEKGRELWAFLPSSEMSKVALNTARVDGSPKVADVFGDFAGGKAMRTVLTFQTGNRNPSATYALDVTDPANPDVIWKYATPGPGVGVAMGWVRDASSILPLTFVQSAATPGSAAGTEIRAIETANGTLHWEQTTPYVYPSPVRDSANPDVPNTGMPGGVTLVPSSSGGTIEHVLVPTLYGQVYKLDADSGTNVYGTTPLFDFGEDFHPIGAAISLYRGQDDGVVRGIVVSGGFADPFAPSGTEWAPDDVNQYAVGFPIAPEGDAVPVTRAQVEADSTLGLHIDFGAGQRAFSPATVAGSEVFVTTDSENVNAADYGSEDDSGRLWRSSLAGGGATYVVIPSGAASVDVSLTTGAVMTGGGDGVQRTNPDGFDAVGASMEITPEQMGSRRLWLRLR
jgi:hypothetical protein